MTYSRYYKVKLVVDLVGLHYQSIWDSGTTNGRDMLVCTVIGVKSSSVDYRDKFLSVLGDSGVAPREIKVLSPNAEDIFIDDCPEAVKENLQECARENHFELVIQAEEHRRKKLVVFDMDSTLIRNECIDLIAKKAGVEPQVAEITERAMRGELDFTASLKERVGLLKGVPDTIYEELKTQIVFTPGAHELCTNLKRQGIKTAVLSGGFIPLAEWVKSELGLDYAAANLLESQDHALTGRTLGDIVDGKKKAELLKEIAKENQIPLEDVLAVGDGSNDLPMMGVAGFGIAFCAKPLVQKQAPGKLNSGNLADILYVLGL